MNEREPMGIPNTLIQFVKVFNKAKVTKLIGKANGDLTTHLYICEVGLRGLLHGVGFLRSSIQIQMRQLNEDLWCESHMQWLRINM